MQSGKLTFIKKTLFFLALSGLSLNAFANTSITVSVGENRAWYPAPVYYGPPAFVRQVVWVPTHREHGYWIPGHYVEYVVPAPRREIVWMNGGHFGHHARWHRF